MLTLVSRVPKDRKPRVRGYKVAPLSEDSLKFKIREDRGASRSSLNDEMSVRRAHYASYFIAEASLSRA
jgi:hypothetical protein